MTKIEEIRTTRHVRYVIKRDLSVGYADVLSYHDELKDAIEMLNEWRQPVRDKLKSSIYLVKVTNMFVTHYEEEKF